MASLVNIIKMIAVLVAAFMVGNMFLSEVRKSKARGEPWYKPYLSAPGLLIILAIMLPIIYWAIFQQK